MDPIRYPIGKFEMKEPVEPAQRQEWLEDISLLANRLAETVAGLSDAQLDTPYREGGWTPRQLAHHIADTHMHLYLRFKWGLSEDHPTVRGFDQDRWTEMFDASKAPVSSSLAIIAGISERWVRLARSMEEDLYSKTFFHSGYGKTFTLNHCLGLASWHGRHHTAQIRSLRERMGW